MQNFKIITTVFNAEKWIEKCINSIKSQSYTNWKQMIIDDCSSDKTWNIIQELTKNDDRFIIKRNDKNKKALRNYVEQIPLLCDNDEDVIVSIDGDDWLYSNDVLEYLNNVYSSENIWFTYGQYIDAQSNNKGCSRPLIDIKNVRTFGVNFSHLKTWKFHLWKRIKDEDLKLNGEYVKMAWDIPMCSPMVEMSGLKRIKYIDKILYVYNNLNPINEYKKDGRYQEWEDKQIRNKLPYKEII